MKRLAVAAFITFAFAGTPFAAPLDDPDTVYIDGKPCNRFCQSYMAWSQQTIGSNQADADNTVSAPVAEVAKEAPSKGALDRAKATSAKAKTPKHSGDLHLARMSPPKPLPVAKTEAAPVGGEMRGLPPVLSFEMGDHPKEKGSQEPVLAALTAGEQPTKVETANAVGHGDASETKAGDAANSKPMVALLFSRSDVQSAAQLKGANIAINVTQAAIEEDLRLVLATEGATKILFSASDANPLDRLVSRDVEAAVIKVVSANVAEAFPEIDGFKVFRIPLSTH